MENIPKKSKEQILAERQAKKAEKLNKKKETLATKTSPEQPAEKAATTVTLKPAEKAPPTETPKPAAETPQVKPPQTKEKKPASKPIESKTSEIKIEVELKNLKISDEQNSESNSGKPKTKAERRAIQEAQRAAKENQKKVVEKVQKVKKEVTETVVKATPASKPSATHKVIHKVKLFKHLYSDKCNLNIDVNQKIHPAIIKLGLQYASDAIVGSNARCYAFLNALKILINDYVTPAEKVFSRGLEAEIQPAMEFLQNCRPFAVSMTNALKYIKLLISQECSNDSDEEKKKKLIDKIDTYAHEQIETAVIAISLKVREKISNGDVILTYGCSSLIKRTLVEAYRDSEFKFKVIVVDSRPDHEGQEMLKSLTMSGINCTLVLINSISFIMPEVTKVLLGAHALLANGYVMSRVGTAQIALIAKNYNVPVLVCCETHKFSERVQTDAFVYNELGDPNALISNKNSRQKFEQLKDWETIPHLTPLNLRYDYTPPELVTAVVTEVAILPCTSVQVILRVKPAE